jgi:hypothetical protein
VLLCTNDEGAPTVGGQSSDACPDGEPFVRWEWTGSSFQAEDGAQGTTMTATQFKEPGEPVEAEWTSNTYNVSGTVVFGGGNTCTYSGDSGPLSHQGTVESCEGAAGGGGNSLALTDSIAASLNDAIDRIESLSLPGQASGSVFPLAFLALGAILVSRRN